MSAEAETVFAGLAHATLEPTSFDLGNGVVLSHTYAHLMAPFMVAFHPAEPGKAHPTPWAAARGGLGFDIHLQLQVPGSVQGGGVRRGSPGGARAQLFFLTR